MGGRKRNVRKIVLAVICTVGVLLLCYFLLVNFLVSAALVPSFMKRLKAFERITDEGYAAQVQTSDIQENGRAALAGTEEWLKTAERQKVSIQSEDGFTLVAEMFPLEINRLKDMGYAAGQKAVQGRSEAEAQPETVDRHRWVILLHGYTGWKEELYPFAYWYHKEGYQVLAPDLRCQGESEGDFIGMGWTDHYDCLLWIQFLLSMDEEAEIVLHGQSMGAATALMVTGEKTLPSNVKAVISDCAYTDAYTMFGEKIKEWFGLPSFPFVDSACLALRMRGGYNLKDASALDAVAKSRTPTLFIHGKQDAMISAEMSRELYEAAAWQKELLIVEGAGHAQSQDKDPDTYYGAIRTFLDKTLAKQD